MSSTMHRGPEIVSIGYEGRDLSSFLDVLVERGTDVLVDVRENAISRKKGFSKTALADGCNSRGIDYVHERSLGNPKDNRDAFRAGEPDSLLRYRRHIDDQGADSIDRIIDLLTDQTVAVLCFESDPASCHRSLVIEKLQSRNPSLRVTAA